MSGENGGPDDPLTSALVDGSTYDRIRATRISTFKWPIRQKLFRLGGLSAGLAAVILSLAGLPPRVVEFLPADPYAVLTRVILVAGIAVSVIAVSGGLLVIAEVARRRLEPMDEARAEAILAFEEMWSLIGFVIGGGTAAVVTGFLIAAHAGVDTLSGVFAIVGSTAYRVVGAPIPPAAIAIAALAIGLTFVMIGAAFPADGQWTGS